MKDRQQMDLRSVMVDTLTKAVDEGVNLVVVVGDSTSTSKIAPFAEKYPERLINVGIAEQNLIGVATGLSLGGFVSVTANAAPFLVSRSNEQIKNDVCYSNSNVKLVGLNAGVCYGPLASTHHAIDDISIMRGFGNIQILAPSDPFETEQIFRYALEHDGPVYIRMDNAQFENLHEADHRFEVGEVDILRSGKDISLFAVGSVVHEALKAADTLQSETIDVEVLNISSIRPLRRENVAASIQKTGAVVTVEEHSLHGGLGSLIAGIIVDEGLQARVSRIGIPEGQFSKAGPRAEIRAFYGIDSAGIAEATRHLLEGW